MSGRVVVDANLALPWVVQEVQSAAARALLADWLAADVARLAPALFASECASAILNCARRGAIDPPAAPRFLAGLLAAVTLTSDDGALAPRALAIAQQLGLGKAYDSLYAALAEANGCEFWTADQRFYNAAHAAFPWVRWLGQNRSAFGNP